MRTALLFLFAVQCSLITDVAAQRNAAANQQSILNPALAPFYHGVASGDPTATAVILWTRYTPPAGQITPQQVNWQVAPDTTFSSLAASGSFTTDGNRDWTVKIDATGLQPGTYYYYRFFTGTDTSLMGRTQTAPIDSVQNLRVAALSCQDYRRGWYNALRVLANRNDIDVVLHTGDYIYETGGGPPNRLHEPDAEIWQLQDYRQRYSQYRLDPDLARCHQVYPWITIFDDHDIVVDALSDTSYRHNAVLHGTYTNRKAVAIQAMREWLPMRDDTAGNPYKNWRASVLARWPRCSASIAASTTATGSPKTPRTPFTASLPTKCWARSNSRG